MHPDLKDIFSLYCPISHTKYCAPFTTPMFCDSLTKKSMYLELPMSSMILLDTSILKGSTVSAPALFTKCSFPSLPT
nr:MAG TPA: hypothetical protein [Myoviridae sp. ctEXz2]